MTAVDTKASFVEVYNAANVNFVDRNYSLIYLSDSFQPLAVFSALNKFTVINYSLRLGSHVRFGTLQMAIGDDLAGIDDVTNVSITDSFTYSPNLVTALGGPTMTNFEFNAALKGNAGDSGIETVILSYKNPIATGLTGSISFDVAYGV